PVLALIIFVIMKASVPFYKKAQHSLDRVSKITRENLSGVRVIRAFSQQKNEVEGFEAANDELTNINVKVGGISALMNPLTYVVVNLAIIAVAGRPPRLVGEYAAGRGCCPGELPDADFDCTDCLSTACRNTDQGFGIGGENFGGAGA
ncbi:MAG: ABC transporter transmembrane domain-containing protein, partial [Clostridia bacterium]|nr:ABC transporter transmembrane domain-containing protein [Clostridia bacterium]